MEQRPDPAPLEAQEAAARSSLTLANRRWIPDPTIRAGYLLDQFTIAGNQHQSFFVGLNFPLTFFDHGQADATAATALAEATSRSRALLRAQSTRDLASLETQQAQAREPRARLQARTLPLARDVVQRLVEVFGLIPGGDPRRAVTAFLATSGRRTSSSSMRPISTSSASISPWLAPGPRESSRRFPRTSPMSPEASSFPLGFRRPRPPWVIAGSAGLALLLVLSWVLLHQRERAAAGTPAVTVEGDTLHIADNAPQWHYVELSIAQQAPALPPPPVPGRVDFDETRTASLSAPLADGWSGCWSG